MIKKIIIFLYIFLNLTTWVMPVYGLRNDENNILDTLAEQYKAYNINNDTLTQLKIISQNENTPQLLGYYHYYLGLYYLQSFSFSEADQSFTKALQEIKSTNEYLLAQSILHQLLKMDMQFDRLDQLSTHLQELKSVTDISLDPIGIADYYLFTSYLDFYYYDMSSAYKHLDQGVQLSIINDYLEGKLLYYYLMSDYKFYYQAYPEALEYANEGRLLYNSSPIAGYYVFDYSVSYIENICQIMSKTNDAEKALILLPEALNIVKPLDLYNTALYYYTAGEVLFASSQFQDAIIQFENSLENYQKSNALDNSLPLSMVIQSSLAESNYLVGNFNQSAKYYYKLQKLNDSMDTLNSLTLGREQMQTETDQSNLKNIDILSKLQNEQNETIKNQQSKLYLSYVVIVLFLIIMLLIFIEIMQKRQAHRRNLRDAETDYLTKVSTRSHIIHLFEEHIKEITTTIALVDIDDFKTINERFGHHIGDTVLFDVAQVIRSSIREIDAVGRYEGDTFLLILNHSDDEYTTKMINSIKRKIDHTLFQNNIKLNVCIAVVHCSTQDTDAMLSRVDQVLHKAKHSGKNQIIYE